jgi:hypothetical protein
MTGKNIDARMKKDFITWVLSQKMGIGPGLDLQNDIKYSVNQLGFTGITKEAITRHMVMMGACPEAMETFKEMYTKYLSEN